MSATVSVYFVVDGNNKKVIACIPNSEIHVPARTSATIEWVASVSPTGLAAPIFVPNTLSATGTNANRVIFAMNSPPSTKFTTTINSSDVPVDAVVSFQVQNTLGDMPPTINGGGTIRNKGTSIFAMAIAAVIGFVLAAIWFEILHPHVP